MSRNAFPQLEREYNEALNEREERAAQRALCREPVAHVRVMMTGGNVGIAKYTQPVDTCAFNDLPEGTPLYTREETK